MTFHTKSIADWQEEVTEWARGKGWPMKSTPQKPRTEEILAKIALAHSELSEAAECVRDGEYRMTGGKPDNAITVRRGKKLVEVRGPLSKPEGAVTEFADTIIRILHICGELDLPLEEAMRIKMEFNRQRPYKHGRKA